MSPEEFYSANKDINWQMPSLPEGITTDYEIADWLLNKSDFGWLELDVGIDLREWKHEAILANQWLVKHRENDSNGWNSACAHGIDVSCTGAWTNYGYTDEKQVPYKWTTISESAPCIKDFWQNIFPADTYRRIRFMEVVPGGYINPHSDSPGRLPGEDGTDILEFGCPVNIAVIHPDDCHLTLEGHGVVPFKEGKAFIINIRKYHSVINQSNTNRIHVIGHPYGYGSKKDKFVELVARSYRKQYDSGI